MLLPRADENSEMENNSLLIKDDLRQFLKCFPITSQFQRKPVEVRVFTMYVYSTFYVAGCLLITNLNNVYYVIFCVVEYVTIYSKTYSALFYSPGQNRTLKLIFVTLRNEAYCKSVQQRYLTLADKIGTWPVAQTVFIVWSTY